MMGIRGGVRAGCTREGLEDPHGRAAVPAELQVLLEPAAAGAALMHISCNNKRNAAG